MSKDSKIASIISSMMILFAIVLFIWILPFIYVWVAFSSPDMENQTTSLRKAVKFSVFPVQKVYTIESIIPSLILSSNYDEAIKNYEEYKKTNTNSPIKNRIKRLAGYAYLHSDKYAEALEIAKELDDKQFLTQIYIKIGNIDTAKVLVQELLKEQPEKIMNYRYLAEIKMSENNWHEADILINKVLKATPNNLEVLKDKTEIAKQLGKTSEYKTYSKRIKEIEYKRNYK